ncbi:MAG: DUF3127 domain-containing protein [Flavobacteriales bacterium]|nr:DUF3127 domain-containing protein [Flavobacteriales bacterium]MDG2246441.1 DUF3127 domain-containing protein [Flavobacteriales bacterium]
MSYELRGRIKQMFDEVVFDSGFNKREFVVTTEEQYPQDIKFEIVKDKVQLLNAFKEGDIVNVKFNIRGSEWNGKYFVNLGAWRIETADQAQAAAPQAQPFPGAQGTTPPPAPMPTDVDLGSAEDDDLPF